MTAQPKPANSKPQQDDVLYEDLTVLETLTYAALLRLPRSMSRAEKAARIEAVIDVLGVRKSRGTIIGEAKGLGRRVMGGELARAARFEGCRSWVLPAKAFVMEGSPRVEGPER